jgi:hypothetical protein
VVVVVVVVRMSWGRGVVARLMLDATGDDGRRKKKNEEN